MSLDAKSAVWEQQRGDTADTMGRRAFIGLISLSTLSGVLFMMLTSTLTRTVQFSGWTMVFASLGFLGTVIVGSILINVTDNIPSALLGLAIITGVTGLYLGPLLAQEGDGVFGVFVLAALVVVAFGIVGVLIPKDLTGWGGTLIASLLAVIVCMLATALLGMFGVETTGVMKLMDWVILILFSVFVMYDFNRALRLPYTAINAVSVSASVFLDYVNIALSLLGIGNND